MKFPSDILSMTPLKYYRVETTKLNFRETWRMVKPPLSVLAVALRALHVPITVRAAYPSPARFANLQVDPNLLSPKCREALDSTVAEWQREGFHSPCYGRLMALGADATDNGGVFLLHPEGRMAAATLFARAANGTSNTMSSIGTFLINGHSLHTTNSGGYFDGPVGSETRLLRGASIPKLIAAHAAELASVPENQIFLVRDYKAFESAFDRREELQSEHLVGRGVYRELPPMELQVMAARTPKLQP